MASFRLTQRFIYPLKKHNFIGKRDRSGFAVADRCRRGRADRKPDGGAYSADEMGALAHGDAGRYSGRASADWRLAKATRRTSAIAH